MSTWSNSTKNPSTPRTNERGEISHIEKVTKNISRGRVWKILLLIIATFAVIGMLLLVAFILIDLYDRNKAAAIARKKCEEYVKQICDQSNPKNKAPSNSSSSPIMGGWTVPDGILPHMAFIQFDKKLNKPNGCSGTLISENFVMTAAHCVQGSTEEGIIVKLGSSNLGKSISFKIDKIYAQRFDDDDLSTWSNDIALLKLEKKIEFDWKTRPICLNTHVKSTSTMNMTTSGWGTNEIGEHSGLLQIADTFVDVSVLQRCIKRFGERYVSKMVCTGFLIERKGACPGDSGGPLQIPLKNGCANTYEQLGILSGGDGSCTTKKSEPQINLYTKVEDKLLWIVGIVWPEL